MPSEKKWCSTYRMGAPVLTAQSTYTGQTRLNFWVSLRMLWPSHKGDQTATRYALPLSEAVTLWRIVIMCKNVQVKQRGEKKLREKEKGNEHQVLLWGNSPRPTAISSVLVLASVPKTTYPSLQVLSVELPVLRQLSINNSFFCSSEKGLEA